MADVSDGPGADRAGADESAAGDDSSVPDDSSGGDRPAGPARRWGRRLAAQPLRVRLALVAAVVLAVVAVLLVVQPWRDGGSGDDPGGGDEPAAGGEGVHDPTSTTLATGGVEVAAPEGWQPIPVADLRFGIAVPPGWEAVVLSPEGLGTLANASPAVPGFVENAHAAASAGGLVYAAGVDQAGGVSDAMVRAAPDTGVTDLAGLEEYARGLASAAGRSEPEIEAVADAARPTVRLRFQVGGDGDVAEGTETLVLGDDGIVWSVTVTTDDPAIHDDLARRITDTLTFA